MFLKKLSFLLIIMMFNHAFAMSIISSHGNEQEIKFNPFFKTEESVRDDLPPPPELNEFDNAILKACGNWGNVPEDSAFIAVLNDPKYSNEVNSLYNDLNHQVITSNADIELFKKELTMVWFSYHAFGHIFCGEPHKSNLGGMHFVGRYLQAQEKQWAGLTKKPFCVAKEEIKPPIYTIGIDFLNSKGKVKTKCQGGYDYDLHAKDILVLATKAFHDFQSEEQGMCLYNLPSGNKAVFVKKNNKAITTFYPDLTPKCDRGKVSCDCK